MYVAGRRQSLGLKPRSLSVYGGAIEARGPGPLGLSVVLDSEPPQLPCASPNLSLSLSGWKEMDVYRTCVPKEQDKLSLSLTLSPTNHAAGFNTSTLLQLLSLCLTALSPSLQPCYRTQENYCTETIFWYLSPVQTHLEKKLSAKLTEAEQFGSAESIPKRSHTVINKAGHYQDRTMSRSVKGCLSFIAANIMEQRNERVSHRKNVTFSPVVFFFHMVKQRH